MTRHVRLRLAAFLLALPVLGIGCIGSPFAPTTSSGLAVDSTAFLHPFLTPSQKFEIQYLNTMIDRYTADIAVARLGQEKAVHRALDSLSTALVDSESAAIDTMTAMLARLGVAHRPGAVAGMDTRLAGSTGAAFETAILEDMVRRQTANAALSQQVLPRASDRGISALARHNLNAENARVALMQSWLCEWYGQCGGVGFPLPGRS